MQIFRKLKTSKATEELLEIYRKKLDNKVLETLSVQDFENLINIAKNADFGTWTAIEAAFCLGYAAGQTALKEKIKTEFLMKGGDSDE